jgi:hypothetical protein
MNKNESAIRSFSSPSQARFGGQVDATRSCAELDPPYTFLRNEPILFRCHFRCINLMDRPL